MTTPDATPEAPQTPPAPETPPNPAPAKPSPPLPRLGILLNVALQLLLLLALAVVANYLSYRHHWRWDFSRNRANGLADKTAQILRDLPATTRVTVWFDPQDQDGIYQDITSLLTECLDLAGDKLTIEYIDPTRNLDRVQELQAKYKFNANENVLIVDSGQQVKFLYGPDLAEYTPFDLKNPGAKPEVTAFLGEEKLAAALLEVNQAHKTKIYFLQGHSELSLKRPDPARASKNQDPDTAPDAPLALALKYLERDNVEAAKLNLLALDEIPADAQAVFILGPQYDLSEREADILRAYWNDRGRLFIALNPESRTPRLHALLRDLGIEPRDNRVIRTVATKLEGVIGVLKDVSVLFTAGSPVTARLANASSQLVGGTQSLKLKQTTAKDNEVQLQPLLAATEGYWGETDYSAPQVFNEPTVDDQAPLYLAASAEKNPLDQPGVKIATPRLIVIGSVAWITSDNLTGPNLDFLLNSLNWLVDRPQLIGVAPKQRNRFSLRLTTEQMQTLWLATVVLMPAAAALLGLAVWWQRRR